MRSDGREREREGEESERRTCRENSPEAPLSSRDIPSLDIISSLDPRLCHGRGKTLPGNDHGGAAPGIYLALRERPAQRLLST